jgi:radical SAM-linked protein
MVRAGWPLAYSQGFNPHPRLTLPLPRNLGTAAACQVALIDLCQPRPPAELFESLARQLPGDCRLRWVMAPIGRGSLQARQIRYELDLDPADAADLGPRIQRLAGLPALVVQRDYGPGKPTRPIDIRPYIGKFELDGYRLRFELRCVEQRTARPSEVITALGLAAETYNHRLRRAAVQWNRELTGPTAGPAADERKELDNQENHCEEDQEGGQSD